MQLQSELLPDGGNYFFGQLAHFAAGGSAVVHEHQGLAVVYAVGAGTRAAPHSFPAGLFDEPAGGYFHAARHGVARQVGVFTFEVVELGLGNFGVFEKRTRIANLGRVGQLRAADMHHGAADIPRRRLARDA